LSLSSNNPTGMMAARVQTRDGNVYWLEWREKRNQDFDIGHALCGSVVTGPLYDSILIKHIPDIEGVGVGDVNRYSTTTDAILTKGDLTVLPLKSNAVFDPQNTANSFVFHFRDFESTPFGRVAVLDVYETKDAPLDLRVIATIHQVIVMAEVAVDGEAINKASGLIRQELRHLTPDRLPFYVDLVTRTLGVQNPSVNGGPATTDSEKKLESLVALFQTIGSKDNDRRDLGLRIGAAMQQGFAGLNGRTLEEAAPDLLKQLFGADLPDTKALEDDSAVGVNQDQNRVASLERDLDA